MSLLRLFLGGSLVVVPGAFAAAEATTGPATQASPAQMVPSQITGVGIMIEADQTGSIFIVGVLPGGPASKAGIQQDDELVAVDGKPASNFDTKQLMGMIRGEEGSEVALTVRTAGAEPRKLTLKRAKVALPPLPATKP